jgi:hypothetical protein
LRNLARRLEQGCAGVAASILEGLDEMPGPLDLGSSDPLLVSAYRSAFFAPSPVAAREEKALRYCIAKQKMLQCSSRDVLGGSYGFCKILEKAGRKVR